MKIENGVVFLSEEESITIKAQDLEIIIKHNHVGVSAYLYYKDQRDDNTPLEEVQWWFDDFAELAIEK